VLRWLPFASGTIARSMASKKVSPKGLGSGIRMIQYFINRAGKDLPAARKEELEKAKRILQEKNSKKDRRAATKGRRLSRRSAAAKKGR
jgi:tRNA(adenine34) deaminase